MKKTCTYFFVFILIGFSNQSCEKKEDAVPQRDQEIKATGTWDIGAGVNYPLSFRNFHYTFEITEDNSAVDITLESPDTEVAL